MSSMSSSPTELARTRRSSAETREHVLSVAEDLFYWQGIHATGVDKIAIAAGIAPTTLYRLFASKDDLVAAYVQRFAEGYKQWIDAVTSEQDRSPRDRILALFEALAEITGPNQFRGCPFLMTLAEYPDPTSAAHASAQAVKAWVRAKLHELTAELALGATDIDVLADQLALVVEGIYASTAALGVDGPASQARTVAATLLDAAVGRRPS
jgi:AcrR family transcriptional regulator